MLISGMLESLRAQNLVQAKSDIKLDTAWKSVTSDDVVMAYRLFLGREPESASVVQRVLQRVHNLQELRTAFLTSPEYLRTTPVSPPARTGNLTWPPIRIDVDVGPDELARMIAHIDATWSELGRERPHWSVLVEDHYRPERIECNLSKFYESGKFARLCMTSAAERCGIALSAYEDCLELGCGVGRVSVWLAELFPRLIATDVSAPHLQLAEEAAAKHQRENISFRLLNNIGQLDNLPEFDVFFSVIVLQHNPPPVIKYLLDRILRRLKPGGLAYFQVPTYYKGYNFDAQEYLANIASRGSIEMHCLPQEVIFELVQKCGCTVREVREDDWTVREKLVSNSLLITKS